MVDGPVRVLNYRIDRPVYTRLLAPAGVRARWAGFVAENQLSATELLMHPAGRFADQIISVQPD